MKALQPAVYVVAAACFIGNAAAGTSGVPLCPGLTIVTAVRQPQGDYESIKRIESVTTDGVRVRYSSYMPDPKGDYDSTSTPAPPWVPFTVYRNILTADLDGATSYMQQFSPAGVPETVTGTTALGISRQVFRLLKSGRPARLTMYQPVMAAMPIKEDGTPAVFGFDYRLPGEIVPSEPPSATITVLVNDHPTPLQAIRAHGKFLWDEGDFHFLDDEDNPLSLKFVVGNAAHPQRDQLMAIKINHACATTSTPARGGSGALESTLADVGKADVYSIHFAFNSDELRDESEPTLKEIADVLRRHPDWKLQVNGHTDAISSDQYNLDLSKRRAAAVKDALVKRYGIDRARLATAGFGESQPKDSNETLEGRARNRRVELVRQP